MNQSINKNIAVIGGGASGCLCAYFLKKAGCKVTVFDKGMLLRTLLPTGGGRCNLAHAEFDFKELAKNYPRGEKFLYSVFSRFSAADTLAVFEEIGVPVYIQEDGRIFPVSNSAKDVREKILSKLNGVNFVKADIIGILQKDKGWKVKPSSGMDFNEIFTDIVIASGGHSGYELIKDLKIKIIPPKPALVGLNTMENTGDISGVVIKNVHEKQLNISGDLLFTHFGISGPAAYKISSIKAFDKFPYKLYFDLCPVDFDFQNLLNLNPHKDVKNILSKYIPSGAAKYAAAEFAEKKACEINGKSRDFILNRLHNMELTVCGTNRGEETVTAGGVDLNEINPKTMEAKNYPHLYFIGEVLNIDGFCGGFNLQNAWSTAFAAAEGICR